MREYVKSGDHTFELVDFVPTGYGIWNIGSNMIDGYLPLCTVYGEDMCQVETSTLKAIKTEMAQEILSNIGICGTTNPTKLQKKLDLWLDNPRRQWEVKRIKKSLPLIMKINGCENLR